MRVDAGDVCHVSGVVFIYARLAIREEADMLAQFDGEYRRYRDAVPAFIPKLLSNHPRKEVV